MRTLIIGAGEVGKSLYKVLASYYETQIMDKTPISVKGVQIMHICFPYSEHFVDFVKKYIKTYHPKYTVIHSTVALGTTRKCGRNVWHSPVRGVHPHLDDGIRTFVKYIGGKYNEEVSKYFEALGIAIKFVDKPETTEALKLWSTTQYGLMIMIQKEIYRWCKEKGLDFYDIYIDPNKTYNEGYHKLGMPWVNRPVLRHMKGAIKGHCILPNAKILDNWMAKLLLKRNKDYEVQ